MQADRSVPHWEPPHLRRRTEWLLLAVWLSLVLALLTRHVVWRDEVRALSLALQGEGVLGMLRGLRGEGHPALWYLLLRAGATVVPATALLPVVSVAVASASSSSKGLAKRPWTSFFSEPSRPSSWDLLLQFCWMR